MVPINSSVADSRGTTFIVHVERSLARRCWLRRAIPQRKPQRLNALTVVQFPLSVLLESRSIAVSF
jgi:hypothetical protein